MQDRWIKFDVSILKALPKETRILLYTPSDDPSKRYRITSAEIAVKLIEATHWQPCMQPR